MPNESSLPSNPSDVVSISANLNKAHSKEHDIGKMNLVQKKALDGFFTHPKIPNFPKYPDFNIDQLSANAINGLEREVKANRVNCDKPTMMSIADLKTVCQEKIKHKSIGKESVHLGLLLQCDSNAMPKWMQKSVRQVASQFNNGESALKGVVTSPSDFQRDKTQGPAEQRTSSGAALARYIHREHCDDLAIISQEPEFSELFYYQNGYLIPQVGQEEKALEFLMLHANNLLLNVERVRIDGKENQAIQVLNSGLALGKMYDMPNRGTDNKTADLLKKMSYTLLKVQYEAVSQVAILEALANPKERIPVVFTLVGGGAFGNNKEAIAQALSEAIQTIEESNVGNINVYLSVYSQKELAEYQDIVKSDPIKYAALAKVLSSKPISAEKLQLAGCMRDAQKGLGSRNENLRANAFIKEKKMTEPTERFLNSTGTEEIKAMQDFIMELASPRPSSFLNKLYKSAFGETTSAREFCKLVNTPALVRELERACGVNQNTITPPPANTTQGMHLSEFKQLAQAVQAIVQSRNQPPISAPSNS